MHFTINTIISCFNPREFPNTLTVEYSLKINSVNVKVHLVLKKYI